MGIAVSNSVESRIVLTVSIYFSETNMYSLPASRYSTRIDAFTFRSDDTGYIPACKKIVVKGMVEDFLVGGKPVYKTPAIRQHAGMCCTLLKMRFMTNSVNAITSCFRAIMWFIIKISRIRRYSTHMFHCQISFTSGLMQLL